MDVNGIINRYKFLSTETERLNFETIWQVASEYCNPPNNDINVVQTPGSRKGVDRLIDVGIRSNRIFTSGLSSHLIPAGVKFFEYGTSDKNLRDVDSVKRYLSDVTSITYEALNNTNFFQEFTKSLSDLGYIGTCCLLTEPHVDKLINFRSHYITSFYISEDQYGLVDTVYFKLSMTARQAYQQFGDKVSVKLRTDANNPKKSETIHTIIHAIEPNPNYKRGSLEEKDRKFNSYYVEEVAKHLVKSGGYYELPYAVGRFYQSSIEKYGRSPALECLSTLNMTNTMERTRIESAQRVSNPPWLSPNDGSVRKISNKEGSIIYWNAANPNSKPEQVNIKDNVYVNDQTITSKIEEVEDAFFLPLFNPLINRQNMTAYESSQRMSIALQNLVPAIGRLTTELLNPIFMRIYKILERAGEYPELPDELRTDKALESINMAFTSKASLALKQMEIAGTYQTIEQVGMLAQMNPEVIDNIDFDEVTRTTAYANSVPTNIIKSKRDVAKIREERSKQAQSQQQSEQMGEMADIYNKTSSAPDAGSGADMLMRQAGI